ncbi:hypothetical protein ElyMa_000595100 [Elysia marginata]|uniref:Uncharacterized protein n=1 Tax=Elysia marginata TaxID=1093978 RepID=A0AAV4G7U7_9GAST|nr:hypothetical protein ElyMa_000595100 [Elysia marginata]
MSTRDDRQRLAIKLSYLDFLTLAGQSDQSLGQGTNCPERPLRTVLTGSTPDIQTCDGSWQVRHTHTSHPPVTTQQDHQRWYN